MATFPGIYRTTVEKGREIRVVCIVLHATKSFLRVDHFTDFAYMYINVFGTWKIYVMHISLI